MTRFVPLLCVALLTLTACSDPESDGEQESNATTSNSTSSNSTSSTSNATTGSTASNTTASNTTASNTTSSNTTTTTSNGTTASNSTTSTSNGTTATSNGTTGDSCAMEGEECIEGPCCEGFICDGESSRCMAEAVSACPDDFAAAEGQPCPEEGVSCGGELCTDPCQFCNILMCEGGTWTRLEAFPDPNCEDMCAEAGEECIEGPCCEGLICDGESSRCVEDSPAEVMCGAGDDVVFPEFERGCTMDSECAAVIHQINCCGTLAATGILASEQGSFDEAEALCREQFPMCRCAQEETTADDGTVQATGEERPRAVCQDGQCTATFGLESGDVCEPGAASACGPGLTCCYPCGIEGCEFVCEPTCDPDDPACAGGCYLRP